MADFITVQLEILEKVVLRGTARACLWQTGSPGIGLPGELDVCQPETSKPTATTALRVMNLYMKQKLKSKAVLYQVRLGVPCPCLLANPTTSRAYISQNDGERFRMLSQTCKCQDRPCSKTSKGGTHRNTDIPSFDLWSRL